jgi:uncharacterized protein
MTEATSIPRIVSFASGASETSVSSPAKDRLLDGNPKHTVQNFFSDTTGQFFAGVWESTPGKWRVSYSENEFCHITRGKVTIDSDDGARWTFAAGDSFVIPAGFCGVWNVTEELRKLYVVFEPASS